MAWTSISFFDSDDGPNGQVSAQIEHSLRMDDWHWWVTVDWKDPATGKMVLCRKAGRADELGVAKSSARRSMKSATKHGWKPGKGWMIP